MAYQSNQPMLEKKWPFSLKDMISQLHRHDDQHKVVKGYLHVYLFDLCQIKAGVIFIEIREKKLKN